MGRESCRQLLACVRLGGSRQKKGSREVASLAHATQAAWRARWHITEEANLQAREEERAREGIANKRQHTWLSGNTATSLAPQRLVGRRRGTGVQFKLRTSKVHATAAPSSMFLLPLPEADNARAAAGVERPLSDARIDADGACAAAAAVWGRAGMEEVAEDAAMLLGDREAPLAGVPESRRLMSSTLRRLVERGMSLHASSSSRSSVRPYCVLRGGC